MTEQYIHPRYFLVETWADLFRSPDGPRQYAKFVQYVISYFRSKKEGRFEDVQALFQLATAEEGLFLSTTVAQIPELNLLPSHGPNSPGMNLLVHLLKEVLRKNAIKSPAVKKKTKVTYENGLSEDDRDKIKEFMFTSKNMELNSSQERFLQSTFNLGFPKAEVAESARHARKTNTEMPRDADGLPINLGMYRDSQPRPPPPRHSKKMMALLRATCPAERSVHERLSPPTPKWPFHVFPSTSKKANIHADFVGHGTPNQVDSEPSGIYTPLSVESGCNSYKGPSSEGRNMLDSDSPPTRYEYNQTTAGFFSHGFDRTRKPVIYEDNGNEPGEPFHMDADLTAGGPGPTMDISLVRDQEVEDHDSSPDDVPAEFLILRESHGEKQERGISNSEEKEIKLRKLDRIAEDFVKFF